MNTSVPSDIALLEAWPTRREQEAAGRLVRRHIDFVHAVARRRLGADAHLADDVTQAVFILLLQKELRFRGESALSSWLYTTTQYASANALRMQRRRRIHEQESAKFMVTPEPAGPVQAAELADLQPMLHEAIDQLARTDRLCVILSYFQQKSHEQVASEMGLSPDAARKRISRAVERMRDFFNSRGVTAPSSSIGSALAVKSGMVSAALIDSTLNIAILSQSTGAAGAGAAIAKAVSHMMFATRLKVAASLVIGLLLAGIVTGQVVKILGEPAITQVAGGAAQPAPATQPQADEVTTSNGAVINKNVVDAGNGVLVEFIGVCTFGQNDWHDINGVPINTPTYTPFGPRRTNAASPKLQALVKITAPPGTDSTVAVLKGPWDESSSDNDLTLIAFSPAAGATSIGLQVRIAQGAWNSLIDTNANPDGVMSIRGIIAQASFSPIIEQDGKSLLFASLSGVPEPMQIVITGKDQQEHIGQPQGTVSTQNTNLHSFEFDIAKSQIRRLRVQNRPYNLTVTAENVCIDPANPTQAKISVKN